MKILIAQPVHENGISQLEAEIKRNPDIDLLLFPEGYLCNEDELVETRTLAKKNNKQIITSYRKANKDRAVIIDHKGNIILDRAKTPPDEKIELITPLSVLCDSIEIGYLLCMEILKGARDLKKVNKVLDLIVHPIGVGMFSEEQFDLWIEEAKTIARTYKTIIMGTSHADGSYQNCGISIPISYCIDSDGEPVYIAKSDTRTRILDLVAKKVQII
ncbi:hypothetical protein [Anaerocolumna sp. MB42-C2]|uniref:hypothetical protein n=1 Tax=Anaerocolumna sp. MB42-C2 TaxID=3070997 RepID=UPI0027E09D38|nr:hypothetical protein [Anaerocolumna sp. MB42-C2]WMJ90635.1 hypothetical protein RBU59_14195 [Anaerocolumna sp. MB42-C2]